MVTIPFFYIGILLIIIWSIYRFIIFKKYKTMNITREIFINLFFIYFLIVINLTFFKMGELSFRFDRSNYANLIPIIETIKMFNNNFMGVGNAIYNVGGNVLLFIPLGFGIPLFYKNKNKLGKVALYGFISSLSIELLQYLTSINISDVDDVIFNTIGAILGFIVFNICYKIIKKTKLVILIDKITSSFNGNLVFLAAKPIGIMVLVVATVSFSIMYSSTISGRLPDEQLASEVFKYSNTNEYLIIKDFSNYKIFISEDKNNLEIKTAIKVFNNRWTDGLGNSFDNEKFDYSIYTLNDDNATGLFVYGKSKDCTSIEIRFNGKKYSEKLEADSYFIVPFPTFEYLNADSDMYGVFNGEKSKDLSVKFLEEDNTECTQMKFRK